MKDLRQRMEMDMDLRGFLPQTKKTYWYHVSHFIKHFDRSLQDMGEEEIRAYLHHLITERGLSQSYVSQTYSALRLLYETTLQRHWDINRIPRSKQRKKLPLVLSELDLTRFGGYLISWEKGDPLCRQHVHLIHLSSKSKWSNWFEPVVRQESWPKSSSPQTRRSGTGWYRPTETRAFEKTV